MTDSLHDDWRAETQTRLRDSLVYQLLKDKCGSHNEPAGDHVLALVDDVVHYAVQRTKLILRHMREFTLHDSDHLFRVLSLMERITRRDLLDKLSVPELMLLTLSAFLHDIGMAPSESEVEAWMRYWDAENGSEEELDQMTSRFARFVKTRPDRLLEISRLQEAGKHSRVVLLQQYLVADYIRITHGERARDILQDDWSGKITYRDTDLSRELAELCFSHTGDPLRLLDMDSSLLCGPDVYACLPFVGVLLRLADILDFDAKRTPPVLFAHFGVRHPVSLSEWQKHRQVNGWVISADRIAFSARCDHPAVEAAIRRFCDVIDRELISCSKVLQTMQDAVRVPLPDHYRLNLPVQVLRSHIGPVTDIRGNPRYQYRDTQFTLSQAQIVDLLMGSSLYRDANIAARELIQNSIDACLLRRAMEATWGTQFTPQITVEFTELEGEPVLRIDDNGIGMDQEIIDHYYATVGSSFYKSSAFYELRAEHGFRFTPISRFGIGILSCFMVSDSLVVDTRRLYGPHESSAPLEVRVEGLDSVFWFLSGNRTMPGTTTELTLRADHPWREYDDKVRVQSIQQAIPNPPFPITIKAGVESCVHDGSDFRAAPTESWGSSSHVRRIDIDLNDLRAGLAGSAAVALLQEGATPVDCKELFSKSVHIDEYGGYEIQTRLQMRTNEIRRYSDSLEVSEEDVETNTSSWSEVRSVAEIAVHGIAVPDDPVEHVYGRSSSGASLRLPFPVNLHVDVVGERDLDLNAARSEIIANEKWQDFVDALVRAICRGVRKQVSDEYWSALCKLWETESKSDALHAALEELSDVPDTTD